VLTLTENAAAGIRNIVDQPEAPMGCGLRIANDPGAGALTLSVAATPAEEDQVLDEAGARVFLEREAAVLLDGMLLDADIDRAGNVRFAVADQPV
jgi:iron-sulfur cluster assembly protein